MHPPCPPGPHPRVCAHGTGSRAVRVVVIGGGVAGLAAAYALARAGHAVQLFEAGDRFGGQVRTFEIGGGRIEAFYHHLFRSDHEIVALIEALGLGADLEWTASRLGMLSGGRLYPFSGPLDLLRYRPVRLLTRLRLGLAALYLRRQRDWRRYEGQRARDWIERWAGREAYARVWGPLLRAKFGRHADDISMVWFWGKIYLRFASRGPGGPFARERLGYLRGSFGRLVDALVAQTRAAGGVLEASRPAQAVVVVDGHVRGVVLVDGTEVPADTVIATVPSPLFERLVPALDAAYRARLQAVTYQWATVLVLALDRPLSPYYWLTVTDADSPFVVAVEQTNFRDPAEYGGRHVVYFSNYTDPDDPLAGLDAGAVLERYEPFIRRINPAFRREWVQERWFFADRAGQPVVHARYHETIPSHETGIRGLYLANTTQVYPEDRGQNYSIRMGQQIARLVSERDAAERP